MKDSPKAQALLDAARAELAAKRKVRETRFADTVLGWESEEEARAADFPQTVIGWDHPAAGGAPASKSDLLMAALMAEEAAANDLERQKARRFAFIAVGIALSATIGFILAGLL